MGLPGMGEPENPEESRYPSGSEKSHNGMDG